VVSFGNEILYNMCEEELLHDNVNIVEGKLWLIGRSYSASPERCQGKKAETSAKIKNKTDSDFFTEIAKIIVKKSSSIDNEIKTLREYQYKYDGSESDAIILNRTIKLISSFNELIKNASDEYNKQERKAKNNISFASKYLHFHLPDLVYILDTYSENNAKKHPSNHWAVKVKNDSLSKNFKFDFASPYKRYAEHVVRCYDIAKRLQQKGEKHYSPRTVDNILMLRK